METETETCCPDFRTEKWDGKKFHWDQKRFVKSRVPTFFHIPFPPMIGNRITKLVKKAEDAGKLDENPGETLLLFTDPNAFMSDIYLSVTGEVPDAKNTTLSGTFLSKVYDGAFKAIPEFIKLMDTYLKGQHQTAKRYFVHYAYCPKCAKKTGHNYMVLFAEV